jgi:hypothetical protein
MLVSNNFVNRRSIKCGDTFGCPFKKKKYLSNTNLWIGKFEVFSDVFLREPHIYFIYIKRGL